MPAPISSRPFETSSSSAPAHDKEKCTVPVYEHKGIPIDEENKRFNIDTIADSKDYIDLYDVMNMKPEMAEDFVAYAQKRFGFDPNKPPAYNYETPREVGQKEVPCGGSGKFSATLDLDNGFSISSSASYYSKGSDNYDSSPSHDPNVNENLGHYGNISFSFNSGFKANLNLDGTSVDEPVHGDALVNTGDENIDTNLEKPVKKTEPKPDAVVADVSAPKRASESVYGVLGQYMEWQKGHGGVLTAKKEEEKPSVAKILAEPKHTPPVGAVVAVVDEVEVAKGELAPIAFHDGGYTVTVPEPDSTWKEMDSQLVANLAQKIGGKTAEADALIYLSCLSSVMSAQMHEQPAPAAPEGKPAYRTTLYYSDVISYMKENFETNPDFKVQARGAAGLVGGNVVFAVDFAEPQVASNP